MEAGPGPHSAGKSVNTLRRQDRLFCNLAARFQPIVIRCLRFFRAPLINELKLEIRQLRSISLSKTRSASDVRNAGVGAKTLSPPSGKSSIVMASLLASAARRLELVLDSPFFSRNTSADASLENSHASADFDFVFLSCQIR